MLTHTRGTAAIVSLATGVSRPLLSRVLLCPVLLGRRRFLV